MEEGIQAEEGIAATGAETLEELQEQKVALARQAAEDEAVREREQDLIIRVEDASDQHIAAADTLADLQKRTADAEQISERCARAEAAQIEIDRMREAQAEGEKLDGLIAAAVVAVEAATKDRAATTRRLTAEIKTLHDQHTREVAQAQADLDRLEGLAKLLGEVPCDGAIAEGCKLLAQARDAAAKRAPARKRLHELEHAAPAADEEEARLAFIDASPGVLAPLEARVTELRGKRAEIVFDAAAAKQAALVAQHAPSLRDMVANQKALVEQIPAAETAKMAALGAMGRWIWRRGNWLLPAPDSRTCGRRWRQSVTNSRRHSRRGRNSGESARRSRR